jgi:hypothetical protein
MSVYLARFMQGMGLRCALMITECVYKIQISGSLFYIPCCSCASRYWLFGSDAYFEVLKATVFLLFILWFNDIELSEGSWFRERYKGRLQCIDVNCQTLRKGSVINWYMDWCNSIFTTLPLKKWKRDNPLYRYDFLINLCSPPLCGTQRVNSTPFCTTPHTLINDRSLTEYIISFSGCWIANIVN